MKKILATFLVVGGLSFSVQAFAASASAPVSALPHMSAAQLKTYDGQKGHKSYVALNGYVYDVSNVSEWKGGHHYKGMKAGTDLSSSIHLSPHGAGIVKELNLKPVAIYP